MNYQDVGSPNLKKKTKKKVFQITALKKSNMALSPDIFYLIQHSLALKLAVNVVLFGC